MRQVSDEDVRRPRPLIADSLRLSFHDRTLRIQVASELSDAGWAAWFGPAQRALRTRIWNGEAIVHCNLDLTSTGWADPLPLMALAVALAEFEDDNHTVKVTLASADDATPQDQRRFLKFLAREGFTDILIFVRVREFPSKLIKQRVPRSTYVGEAVLTTGLIDTLEELNVPLAFERSTCLRAKLLWFGSITAPDHSRALDDIDQWVERELHESIDPVVSDMVPNWAQRGVRHRLLMTLRELLHNIAEHAYEEGGYASVYVRYREGALGEAPDNWARVEKFVVRERDHWRVPLLAQASERESFPRTRSGFFEVFVLDAGKGISRSLGEQPE